MSSESQTDLNALRAMTCEQVFSGLGLSDAKYAAWQGDWQVSGASFSQLMLDRLCPRAIEKTCRWLEMDESVLAGVLEALTGFKQNPLLLRLWWHLLARMEQESLPITHTSFVALPEALGRHADWFYLFLCLSLVPRARRIDRRRGVPEDVTRQTLRDIVVWLKHYRGRLGWWGKIEVAWYCLHLSGCIHQLGRLQFERTGYAFENRLVRRGEHQVVLGLDQEMQAGDQVLFEPGTPVLNVHISAEGTMSHEACDESFARSKVFFEQCFPDYDYRGWVCFSWLLDAQLAEYLPAQSNIVRFLSRWTLLPEEVDDGMLAERVLGEKQMDWDHAPQNSSLQRITVAHLKSGKKWYTRGGYILSNQS